MKVNHHKKDEKKVLKKDERTNWKLIDQKIKAKLLQEREDNLCDLTDHSHLNLSHNHVKAPLLQFTFTYILQNCLKCKMYGDCTHSLSDFCN